MTLAYGVKPLICQSELRTYTKVVPFQEINFLSLCSIVTTTEWNGLIKIDNWGYIYMDYFEPKFDGLSGILIPLWMILLMTYKYWISLGLPSYF